MVLAVLPMVELVGVAEGVHDSLEDRFQIFQVNMSTPSTSRTPSATSTSSTMGSTASTIYIHKNEHLKYVS